MGGKLSHPANWPRDATWIFQLDRRSIGRARGSILWIEIVENGSFGVKVGLSGSRGNSTLHIRLGRVVFPEAEGFWTVVRTF
jgi:hypothetical protein